GSAQLSVSGPSIVERNDCNETVILPCYATDLIQKNENIMFVTWQRQGIIIFSYHGGTKNFNTAPSFSSARLLSPSDLANGVASLVLSSAQATVGNYSCKVTESNREGVIRMEIRNSSGSWFLLVERAVIISLVCLLVIFCAAQFSVIGKYLLFNSLQLLIYGDTVQNRSGLGLIVIPAVILVPLQYVMFGIG
ncbi:CD47 protein, partial [Prunella fulvescens]|nr:CD47 protein [Prunella fulvescens]